MSLLPDSTEKQSPLTRTVHAMLIPWGVFAQEIGLIKALEKVPIPQRCGTHSPQSKVLEFLVAILSGCQYLQDISRSAHPLDQDQAVARAWGQDSWADYSGVSRTLNVCTAETVDAVRTAVVEISRPFIKQEIDLSLQQEGVVIYDGDLTGRPVSKGSTTFEGAAFGWMDDGIRFGYQAALVSVCSPTYGRLWLSVAPHPGNTISSQQVEAMIGAVEANTGLRPLRRDDLLTERIKCQRTTLQNAQQRCANGQERCQTLLAKLETTTVELIRGQAQLTELENKYRSQGRDEKPYSRLAQIREKVGVYERRLNRQCSQLVRARQTLLRQQARVQESERTLSTLETRHACFLEDNRDNHSPIRAIFRLDAGFGIGENIALLIEMGYEVYTKALHHALTQAVRTLLTPQAVWKTVAPQADMAVRTALRLDFCPYPLNVGVGRFHYPDQEDTYTLFLHYGQTPVTKKPAEWFTFYNRRQTIEAGIKEGKSVFQMHHLKVRSQAGLAIQEQFAALAANLVRWAAHWLHERCPTAQFPGAQAQVSVKHLVRVAANTSALVSWQSENSLLLRFDELSLFAGLELHLGQDIVWQLPLPLFSSDYFAPS